MSKLKRNKKVSQRKNDLSITYHTMVQLYKKNMYNYMNNKCKNRLITKMFFFYIYFSYNLTCSFLYNAVMHVNL